MAILKLDDTGGCLKCFSTRLRRIELLNIVYMVILPILVSRTLLLEFRLRQIVVELHSNDVAIKNISDFSIENIEHGKTSFDNIAIIDTKIHGLDLSFSGKEIRKTRVENESEVKSNVVNGEYLFENIQNPYKVSYYNESNPRKLKGKINKEPRAQDFRDHHRNIRHKTSKNFQSDVLGNTLHPLEYKDYTISSRNLLSSVCNMFPMLSPRNNFNNFTFSDRISEILDLIYALSSIQSVHMPGTPQYWAACWLIYDDVNQTETINREVVERYLFGLFLYAMEKETLMPIGHICNYNSNIMNCTEGKQVSQLRFSGSKETSFLPSEISRFAFLETLDLSSNQLIGSFPSELHRLNHLKHLDLSFNHFSGTISSTIGHLKKLKTLNLQANQFTGSIPHEIGQLSQLEIIALDRNMLEGPIPLELYECNLLYVISFFANRLNGTISSRIGQLKNMEILFLGVNQFSGSIPNEMGKLSAVKYLHADSNKLTGPIPEQLEKLHLLERIWLNDNILSGQVPELFGNMSTLSSISLSNNRLSGSIPNSIWENKNIHELFIDNNLMTGVVPTSFCDSQMNSHFVFDLSLWFNNEPKVQCDCCERVGCSMWEDTFLHCYGEIRFEYTNGYSVTDQVTGINMKKSTGEVKKTSNMCLSPTGCYNFNYHDAEGQTHMFTLSYSRSENKLIQQDHCDAVEVCGVFIDAKDPKRIGLNQLTQIGIPNSLLNDPSTPQAKALCWIMTHDPFFGRYLICDGTILQRYVLILFLHESLSTSDFDEFASKPTCEWDYIVCGPEKKFVKKIIAPNQNLSGTLVTELSLLMSLEELDLSNNELNGSIDPSIFATLPSLKIFNVGNNSFVGTIPKSLLELPGIKKIILSDNKFIGHFSKDIAYSKNLEVFNVSNNLLGGPLPEGMTDCRGMKKLDMSMNNFDGFIPTEFGSLNYLQEIRLNMNKLSGSIPKEIFDITNLEVLFFQANKLTGNIPIEIITMSNATEIALDHNKIKGTIPMGLENLKNLRILHLQDNRLSGSAPPFFPPAIFGDLDKSSYIVDCGNPAYLLPNSKRISCTTCTICCNSEGKCQENIDFDVYLPTVALFAFPFVVSIIFYILSRTDIVRCKKQSTLICSDDSVYCFIFSDQRIARFVHIITAGIQFSLFAVYLEASNLQSEKTDWLFTFRCPENNIDCKDEKTRSWAGWFLFAIVTTSYLGTDLFQGILQLQYAAKKKDFLLFCSGFLMVSLTLMAFYASITYNLGRAATNTDLIMNAVILLFINDLDEQLFSIFRMTASEWTETQVKLAKTTLEAKMSTVEEDLVLKDMTKDMTKEDDLDA